MNIHGPESPAGWMINCRFSLLAEGRVMVMLQLTTNHNNNLHSSKSNIRFRQAHGKQLSMSATEAIMINGYWAIIVYVKCILIYLLPTQEQAPADG